jgi:hypothetical protein
MALALRRTGSGDYPDWDVIEDERVVGRIYEAGSAPLEDVRWIWAHNQYGVATGKVQTHGRAPTFDDAKAQLTEALKQFREWRPTDSNPPSG